MAQSLASFCRFLFVVMLPKNLALAMGQCCPALFWGWMGKPGAVGEPGVSTGLNMVEEVQQNAATMVQAKREADTSESGNEHPEWRVQAIDAHWQGYRLSLESIHKLHELIQTAGTCSLS